MEEKIRISSSVVSHTGDGSQLNENGFFVNGKFMYHRKQSDVHVSVENSQELQVFAVCKGMGDGTDRGKRAFSVNDELKRFLEKNIDGQSTMEELFDKFYELVDEAGRLVSSMGEELLEENGLPVLAGMLVKGSDAGVLSLGNTRIYRLRNGSLKQLTADKRRTERLLKLGIITDEQAEAVSSRLGDVEDEINRVKRTEIFELSKGDIYVLCNSADFDYIDEDALLYILSTDEDTSMIAGTLMDEVLKRQADNDMTIQVIKVEKLAKDSSKSRGVAAPPTARTHAGYAYRRSVRPSKSSVSKAKIKRAIRLVAVTIVLFSLVFGLLSLIDKLLFPRESRDPSDTTDTSAGITEQTENGTTDGTETETQPVDTEPTNTTEPTEQESTGTSPSEPEERTHVVKGGETLYSIAKQYYNDGSKYLFLQEVNGLPDPDHIEEGQVLVIPYLD